MGTTERNLSKSKVMKGLQCPKQLYLFVHQSDRAGQVPAALQAVFDQGHRVGAEAQKRYPGGVLIEAPHTELTLALKQTTDAIASGALVLYEAMAVADGTGAQIAFEELIADGTTAARKAELRQAMLDYCRKDTVAMVNLVEWLRTGERANVEIS